MTMPKVFVMPASLALASWTAAFGDLADELADLRGHIVLEEERIENFEGCSSGDEIRFDSGRHVVCGESGYGYGYSETAVILVNPVRPGSVDGFACTMVVADDAYSVSCLAYMRDLVAEYCESAAYPRFADLMRHRLTLLGLGDACGKEQDEDFREVSVPWGGHRFKVHGIDAEWLDVPGVYVFAARSRAKGRSMWRAIYVGGTESFGRAFADRLLWTLAGRFGATHVHALVEANADRRAAIEKALVETYVPPMNRGDG